MKSDFLKKSAVIALSSLMVVSFCACNQQPQSEYPKNGATKIVSVETNFYAPTGQADKISLAHYENQSEIPLVEINYAANELINEGLFKMMGASEDTNVTIEETNTTATLTRENGEYCEIDFVQDTILFSDFSRFNMKSFSSNPYDLLSSAYKDEEGNSIFIERNTDFYTPGYSLLIDLAERNIPLDIYAGKKYMPLQTFNDLFFSPFGLNLAYNGEAVFLVVGNELSPEVADIYYHEEKSERSDALTEFNYNELCLYLDLYYGLQDEHGFDNGFSYYLESIGLKEQLMKNDAINTFNALGTLTLGYFADSHSSIVAASPYLAEANPSEGKDITVSEEIVSRVKTSQAYEAAREEGLGAEFDFYDKRGNTAYITFDEFSLGDRSEGYGEAALQIGDVLTIIMIAHARIAQDPEIENVVVDLSCNGGGAVDSCAYLVAWMLGSAEFSIYDSVAQSRATMSYSVDVNMDGVFDEDDTISDKNLYCLISPVSFSCGNYAPALLKASGRVTIIGKESSGGGCVVRKAVTADGTFFCISDSSQMSVIKNGTYYSVDQGVEPHITLSKIESFYDRDALTEFINSRP